LQAILLFVACFACYGNTLANGYAYDDAVVITENKFTLAGIAGIPGIFGQNTFAGSYEDVPLLERYRPLSLATFAVERDLFGPNPHVAHAFNVLLFAFSTCLLWAFLRRLLALRGEAQDLEHLPFIAALLFAVHPVHTEIVANIKGRDELLVLVGALSGLLFVFKYLDGHRRAPLGWAFLCFSLALFSKENAITFLAIVPLTVFTCRKGTAKDTVVSLLPIILASALFLVVRGMVLAGAPEVASDDILTNPFALASPAQRFATVVATLGAYLRLLVFPHPLTIDYQPFHISLRGWGHLSVWLSLAAYGTLAGLAVVMVRKRSLVAYGILFYLATLSIVSNLPFSTGTFMSERFIFVPSVGFVIVLGWLLANPRFRRALPSPRVASALVAALVLAGSIKTFARNGVWKDDFTLLTTDARTSENSVKANMAAAVTYLLEANRPERASQASEYRTHALEHAKKAVFVYEQNVEPGRRKGGSTIHALTLLANAYSENGLLSEAIGCYRTVIGAGGQPESLEEMIQTAINQSSDVEFRLNSTLEFAALVPGSFTFNYHLGLLYGKDKNDIPMAIAYFRKAADIAPDDVNALRGLGHAYTLANDFEAAARCFQRLSDRAPGDASLLRSLYDLYGRAGNTAKQEDVARRLQALAE
jgi:tetratricopeptide (TPR) repeat protein